MHIASNRLRPCLGYAGDVYGSWMWVQTATIPNETIRACLRKGTNATLRQKILPDEAERNETDYGRALCLLSQAWMAVMDSGLAAGLRTLERDGT